MFLCLLLQLITATLYAQKENNIWNFGTKGHGMDFNGGKPVLIRTSGEAEESCASVCDTDGRLLFYTDGTKLFDRTGAVMPNSSGLSGDQWMIIHHGDSAIFYAYPLGSSLIPGTPVVSVVGDAYGPHTFFAGEMNMSTDFRQLAMNAYKPSSPAWGYVQLFDFDKVTGTVSNYRKTDSSIGFHYAIEFSPDGSKLYVGSRDYRMGFYQYDLYLKHL